MNGHTNMILALTVGPVLGLAGAWLVRLVVRRWRRETEVAIPAACSTVAMQEDIQSVRSATARMKSKTGI